MQGLRQALRSALPWYHQQHRWLQLAGYNSERGFSFEASPLPQSAESGSEPSASHAVYVVTVTTGRRRGAGTTDPVAIQLIGAMGQTDKFLLDTADTPFERGSSRVFRLPVADSIGPLRRVHIEKQMSQGYDPGRGWYLKQVLVENPVHGERVLFPCNSWLGDSDCGGYKAPCERNLLPAAPEMTSAAHEPVRVAAAGMAIPHPEKVTKQKGVNQQGSGHAGEDSYFFCEGRNQLFGMGVADGVYGWRDVGIDSGVMSQTLMQRCMAMIQSGVEDVYKILHSSSNFVLSQGIKGSCTACILTINQDNGQLHAANLGDSGFMVLGRAKDSPGLHIKFRTSQMEHEFGRPLQLGHHANASRAEHADLVSFYVSPGDLIIMGSDGLFDNLNEVEISSTVTQMLGQGASCSTMVQALVKLAFEASVDRKRDTPYARDASEAFNAVYSGGKRDDITVLVAHCK